MQDKHLRLTYKTLRNNAKKYWKQRYSLFSKFDEGILMNQELWFSVTPEDVAIFTAKILRAYFPNEDTELSVMDLFCGGGGNTIQLAKRFNRVLAIDINQENLYCTENNCYVYGLNENVEFIEGDWVTMDKEQFQGVDVLFASPPWGGPGYKSSEVFDLEELQPMGIRELLITFFAITENVCLFLPRNSDVQQLSEVTKELLGEDAHCKIVYTYYKGFLKGILVMFGKFAETTQGEQAEQSEQTEQTEYIEQPDQELDY